MGSARERIENERLASLYAARAPKGPTQEQIAQQRQQEREARLRAAAETIHKQEIELFLAQSGMTEDEQDVICKRLQSGSVNALGSADVWTAQLLRLRAESQNALSTVFKDANPDECETVLRSLPTPEQRLGLDQGRSAAEKLRQIRSDAYFN